MKRVFAIAAISLTILGCGGMQDGCWGWTAKGMTGSGQVKRVGESTPLLCPNYSVVDVSLGVMREGVGSMSTQDMEFFIEDKDVKALTDAAKVGAIINFSYDVRRSDICVPKDRLTSFSIERK